MLNTLKDIWGFCLSNAASIIAIAGLFFTNINLRKSFRNEICKLHKEKSLERIVDLPIELINVLDSVVVANDNNNEMLKLIKRLNNINDKILAYGSQESIKVAAKMMDNMYYGAETPSAVMALSVLLIAQIRFDVSGEIISPDYWYRLKLKDYKTSSIRKDLERTTNKYVSELGLNPEMAFKAKK